MPQSDFNSGLQINSEFKKSPDLLSTLDSETQREMTFGEKLVGLTFNPSNDDKVGKAKRLCAELADLLFNDTFSDPKDISEFKMDRYKSSINEILNAQMNVVKVLTLKY